MAMFDPAYVTEVLDDILSRRGMGAKNAQNPDGKPGEPQVQEHALPLLQ